MQTTAKPISQNLRDKNTGKNDVCVIPIQVCLMLQTLTSVLRQTKNAIFHINWLTPTEHVRCNSS